MVSVAKFDVSGHRDAVLGNFWRAKGFVDYYITTSWSESDLHCIGEQIGSLEHERAGICSKLDFLPEISSWHTSHDHVVSLDARQESSVLDESTKHLRVFV